jgi:hypothetical protein
MSQKSSLPQAAKSVARVLMSDSPRAAKRSVDCRALRFSQQLLDNLDFGFPDERVLDSNIAMRDEPAKVLH